MKPKSKKVQVDVPLDLYKKMKVYLAQNDMTWQDFLTKSITKIVGK